LPSSQGRRRQESFFITFHFKEEHMKDGLIVYVVSETGLPANFDLKTAARSLGQTPHRVELVSRNQGFFTVEDAWHFLWTRGCGRINLLVAEPDNGGTLKALSPAVRLCG
jgi:hypothetical protein